MDLWMRSWVYQKGFKSKIYDIHPVEFKSLPLFCNLKS